MCVLQWTHRSLNDAAIGIDGYDEEVEQFVGKRRRKESALASKKLEKGPVAKLKKRPRVLVEVMFITT